MRSTYHMPSFYRYIGMGLFWVYFLSLIYLAPFFFYFHVLNLHFIVLLIILVLPHQSLSKPWVLFA